MAAATLFAPTSTERVRESRDRRPCGGSTTLAQLLDHAYETSTSGSVADCPVCGSALSGDASCRDCGSRLR